MCLLTGNHLPFGKRLQKIMENHHCSWVNPLFLSPFSIAFVCLPEGTKMS